MNKVEQDLREFRRFMWGVFKMTWWIWLLLAISIAVGALGLAQILITINIPGEQWQLVNGEDDD